MKSISILLAIAIAAVLTACGGTNEGATIQTPAPKAPSQDRNEPEEEEEEKVEEPEEEDEPEEEPEEKEEEPEEIEEEPEITYTDLQDEYCNGLSEDEFDKNDFDFEVVTETQFEDAGFSILEGPVWYEDDLYLSLISGGKGDNGSSNPSHLMKLNGNSLNIEEQEYGANGLALDEDGKLITARHYDGSITLYEADNQVVDEYQGNRFNSPNDLVVSSNGDVYFTDPTWQAPENQPQNESRVYHVKSNGRIDAFEDDLNQPNGIMLSWDERTLYVGYDGGVKSYELDEDGNIDGNGRNVNGINGITDGMSKDCAGNIYITNDREIKVILKDSNDIETINLSQFDVQLSNIAFGGRDGKTVYVTAMGGTSTLLKSKASIEGFPY